MSINIIFIYLVNYIELIIELNNIIFFVCHVKNEFINLYKYLSQHIYITK